MKGIVALLCLCLSGCAGTNVQSVDEFANVQVPVAVRVGQSIPVKATFILFGCPDEMRVLLRENEAERRVEVRGELLTTFGPLWAPTMKPCPAALHYVPREASFTPRSPGTYRLEFRLRPMRGQGPYDRIVPKVNTEDIDFSDAAVSASIAVEATE